MNRRGFLTAVGALTAGFILDEATGLLVPRKKIWQVPGTVTAYREKHRPTHYDWYNPDTGISIHGIYFLDLPSIHAINLERHYINGPN